MVRAELVQYRVEPESFWRGLLLIGCDGYDVIERAQRQGWRAVPCWGKDGWDLGSWPLAIVFFRDRAGCYEVIEYVEGDVTPYQCPTKELRNAITDELAFFHWKHQGESWVEGYASVEQLPDTLRGPYQREH